MLLSYNFILQLFFRIIQDIIKRKGIEDTDSEYKLKNNKSSILSIQYAPLAVKAFLQTKNLTKNGQSYFRSLQNFRSDGDEQCMELYFPEGSVPPLIVDILKIITPNK